MATITFKAKIRTKEKQFINRPGMPVLTIQYVKIPALTRNHCDMGAFHSHPAYRGIVNSDLFLLKLGRAVRALVQGGILDVDRLPEGVVVDTSGFLAEIIITI